jgi:hypothetical protein
MGSGEEWANDAPRRGGWSCPLALAGIVSAALLSVYGLVVVVSDVVKLLS